MSQAIWAGLISSGPGHPGFVPVSMCSQPVSVNGD